MGKNKIEKKYFEDLKNLKPRALDIIPRSVDRQSTIVNYQLKQTHQSSINNQQSKQEVVSMEGLNNSKTLWGFGIAVFIYIIQNILVALNVVGPDNLIMKSIIEAVIAIAGLFGVYGIRDALRKMQM